MQTSQFKICTNQHNIRLIGQTRVKLLTCFEICGGVTILPAILGKRSFAPVADRVNFCAIVQTLIH
jgi:hypothetical protein